MIPDKLQIVILPIGMSAANFIGDGQQKKFEDLPFSPHLTAGLYGQFTFLSVLNSFLSVTAFQQQTQPTYDAGSGNRTRDTLVGGERAHHYSIALIQHLTKKISAYQGGYVWEQATIPGQTPFSQADYTSR